MMADGEKGQNALKIIARNSKHIVVKLNFIDFFLQDLGENATHIFRLVIDHIHFVCILGQLVFSCKGSLLIYYIMQSLPRT
jgi:hypothetical protein